jgi:glutathione synthase
MKKLRIGVVMDPIATINYKKDSTMAMLWEADKRGCEIFYFEQKDLFLLDGVAAGLSRSLKVYKDPKKWFKLGKEKKMPLADLDVILMRKDPPFDSQYVYTTYILESAQQAGVLVINNPRALRDANEKVFATLFPQCSPPSLVTKSIDLLQDFFHNYEYIVCKPLDSMGGSSIFYLKPADVNSTVVFETLTQRETQFVMAQKYIPEIVSGDKRILIINGKPVPFSLARVPAKGEWRGNLVAGATGEARPLTERDRYICDQVGTELVIRGLYFVGIDVIGDFLTEVNVTSPTCIRELDEQCSLNIAGILFDFIDEYCQNKSA